jgi:hypothetical protein
MNEKKLVCRIEISDLTQTGGAVYNYAVYDGEDIVAEGSSSSPDWVKHDAGGYHTKAEFDIRYPEGWKVSFDF